MGKPDTLWGTDGWLKQGKEPTGSCYKWCQQMARLSWLPQAESQNDSKIICLHWFPSPAKPLTAECKVQPSDNPFLSTSLRRILRAYRRECLRSQVKTSQPKQEQMAKILAVKNETFDLKDQTTVGGMVKEKQLRHGAAKPYDRSGSDVVWDGRGEGERARDAVSIG